MDHLATIPCWTRNGTRESCIRAISKRTSTRCRMETKQLSVVVVLPFQVDKSSEW